MTLPAASAGVSRFVTFRKADSRGRVVIHAPAGGQIDGARQGDEGDSRGSDRDRGAVVLESRGESVTLVSDGATWSVFADQR